MTQTVEFAVPDIGDFKDVPIIEVLVKVGDIIKPGDPLVTLESDKATLEVPAEIPGRVAAVKIVRGDRVSKGSALLTLESAEVATPDTTPDSGAGAQPPVEQPRVPRRPEGAALTLVQTGGASAHSDGSRLYASPSVRRAARELGVDLSRIQGSGPRGRVLASDVQDHVRAVMRTPPATATSETVPSAAAHPAVDFSRFGPVERQPLSRIRRISGAALARNWSSIPHVTNFEEADVTELDRLRAELSSEWKSDPKISIVSFLVKACAVSLRAFPSVNSSLDGAEIVLKRYVHVGVAVDTPSGLLVPVVRNADQLGVREIATTIAARANEAKEGKLKATQMEGGCFTISSLGGIGNTGFTPIINAPEVAILGVCKATLKPRWNGKEFVPRLILPLALSWDHRVLDGVEAARFLVHLSELLQDFRRVSL